MSPDGGASHLVEIDPAGLPTEAAGDKDRRAVQPGDTVTFAGIGVYSQGLLGMFHYPIHETRYSFNAE